MRRLALSLACLWVLHAGAAAAQPPGAHRQLALYFENGSCDNMFPNYNCPQLVFDYFEPLRICVPGGTLLINSDAGCTVEVSAGTWAQVKRMYE